MNITAQSSKLIIALLALSSVILIPDVSFSAEYATFESFYKEGLSVSSWIIGGVLAVAGAAAVLFTAGAAAPFTAAIGSAIGGMMGLSGAAATSAGLALLGGGSLAAGGFGMLGGTVVLTAIFECTTLAGGQAFQAVINKKNYTELCEQIKDYPNFPPIQNDDGPKVIGLVKNELEKNYDLNQLPSSQSNMSAVNNALIYIQEWSPRKERFYDIGYETNIRREKLRVYSLRAILEFMANDNKFAYKFADAALSIRTSDDGPCTVPTFIKATSGMVIGNVDSEFSLDMFNTVIIEENKAPIIPLLYSIYISRLGALGKTNSSFLEKITDTYEKIDDKEIKDIVIAQLMTASLAKLWEYKETINFYRQNFDQLNNDEKLFEMANKIAIEYKKMLNVAGRHLRSINRESNDGSEFYYKSRDALVKYFEAHEQITEYVDEIKKMTFEKRENSDNNITMDNNDD